jgi:2-oxoglutarate ferredoxin oxidoreductase subunit alpha
MPRQLLEGNEAIAEAAIRAGLQAYFGYPITPQTQLLEWMSHRMPELGRAFVQAESELGAINMVYGAACTGARAMTSSSGPGISLKMEGLSYIAGTEVPMVLVNVMRGGPGLGNIAPSQADYNQAVHGGGHGDYYPIVLVPSSVQEAIDLTVLAFDLAEKYRSIAIVLLDGSIGQMMEPAELPPMREVKMATPDWAVSGCVGRERRLLSSIHLNPVIQEQFNLRIMRRWQEIKKAEVRYREYFMEGARFAIVSFGSAGRVCFSAVRTARAAGIPVGLIRPITVSPFPEAVIEEISKQVDGLLVVEMNGGQMLTDVQLAVKGRVPVSFYGRPGGTAPFPDEVVAEIEHYMKHPVPMSTDPRIPWLERMGSMN